MASLTIEEEYRILIALEVPFCNEAKVENIRGLLANVKSSFHQEQVRLLLHQLEKTLEAQHVINTEEAGLTKLDVIEYTPSRTCTVNVHVDRMRRKLATAIGYEFQNFMLF